MYGFEDAKDGGVGFLFHGFGVLGALGELNSCSFFSGAHCYGRWRWNKRSEILGEFLNINVEVVLGLGVEVGGFSVGVGCLGDGSAEVGFFLLLFLLLGSIVTGVGGSFEVLDCGGYGVDDVCWVGFLMLFGAED